jgi:hypothetical protein
MNSFEAAHLDIMDVPVVLIFVNGRPTSDLYALLQKSASEAGLTGEVVAIWPDEIGRTRFLAPPEFHAFFRVAGYDQLRAQTNTTLKVAQALSPANS